MVNSYSLAIDFSPDKKPGKKISVDPSILQKHASDILWHYSKNRDVRCSLTPVVIMSYHSCYI